MMINNGVSFGNVLPKLSHDFLFGHGSMSSQGDQDFDAAGFDPAIFHFLHQSRQDLLYRCGPGIVINDDQNVFAPSQHFRQKGGADRTGESIVDDLLYFSVDLHGGRREDSKEVFVRNIQGLYIRIWEGDLHQ